MKTKAWFAVTNGKVWMQTKTYAMTEDEARVQILDFLAKLHNFNIIRMWANGNYEVTSEEFIGGSF